MASPDPFTHAVVADDLDPGSQIMYRLQVLKDPRLGDDPTQALRALQVAMRLTALGSPAFVRQRPGDPEQAYEVTAALSVEQAIQMVYQEVRTVVGGDFPDEGTSALGGDAVEAWAEARDGEARQLGIPRLAFLLERAGIVGDHSAAAERLWDACGYGADLA